MALEVRVVMETPCAVAICSFFTGVTICFTIIVESGSTSSAFTLGSMLVVTIIVPGS